MPISIPLVFNHPVPAARRESMDFYAMAKQGHQFCETGADMLEHF